MSNARSLTYRQRMGLVLWISLIPVISCYRALTGHQSLLHDQIFGCVGKRISMATTRTIGQRQKRGEYA